VDLVLPLLLRPRQRVVEHLHERVAVVAMG
jgi:hypothetical protein